MIVSLTYKLGVFIALHSCSHVIRRAKVLLEAVLKVYRVKFRHAFGLLGDQLALADVIRASSFSKEFKEGVAFEALVMATRTLFLPCAFYNWTPSEGAGQFHGMPTEVQVTMMPCFLPFVTVFDSLMSLTLIAADSSFQRLKETVDDTCVECL